MEAEPKKTNKSYKSGTMVGLGIALGVAFGAAFDNVGLGIALGVVFGAVMDKRKKEAMSDDDLAE